MWSPDSGLRADCVCVLGFGVESGLSVDYVEVLLFRSVDEGYGIQYIIVVERSRGGVVCTQWTLQSLHDCTGGTRKCVFTLSCAGSRCHLN